jgi:hypothetical protein
MSPTTGSECGTSACAAVEIVKGQWYEDFEVVGRVAAEILIDATVDVHR